MKFALTRRCRLFLSLFRIPPFFACLLVATVSAQSNPGDLIDRSGNLSDQQARGAYVTAPNTGVLIFSVYGERTRVPLGRQALLKLVNLTSQTATWQTTEDESQAVFSNIPYGTYNVEVSAVGYLSEHQDLRVVSSLVQQKIEIVLHHDPAAVNLDVAGTVMSPKARKETKRAVSALKSGNFKEAQKHLDQVLELAPTSPDLNFLLGYLYFEKHDFARATTYLTTAAKLDPQNAQTLTLLGRTGLETKDYPAARSSLEQAVRLDPGNWLPHDLLADAYLHEKSYGKARDEAQVAIAKGNNAAGSAQLVLGEALLNLGRTQEGIQALSLFLQTSPRHPVAGQVRDLIAEIQQQESVPATENVPRTPLRLSGVDPLSALPATQLSLKAWQPPGVDDVKMAVAPGVTCPTEKVIEESGKHVVELVEDVTRFVAVEDLFHQALDQYGTPVRTESRKYNYAASISEPQPGYLAVDEDRSGKLGLSGYPDQIASTGFAALALVFHPHMRDNFAMSCEGLGDWRGQASWLVHFRQRDDRPNRMHSYKVGNQLHPVRLKGRAWITADKFQIVRIEAEMVSPMPEIQLLSEHQVVEYGPIEFHKKNVSLWLPKSAELYFDFRKHRYYRRHSFDHYMLFSVDSDEQRKEPVSPPAKPTGTEGQKP
jgi:tetratricopeptide (TPR) repeat protein